MEPYVTSNPDWSASERRHFRRCVAASLLLFFVGSIFATGFHHADEYFQIVEFASTKLGLTDTSDLPWEYREKMRSWLQPAIYVAVARAAQTVGIDRPLTLLFLFRLFTALVAWASLWTLLRAGRRWFESEDERLRVYSFAAFLWLIPYLGVRTSGETMATASLCFAIALLERRTTQRDALWSFGAAVLAGLCFGLCFGFRYPSGAMAAGAVLWYLRPAERRIELFTGITLGAGAALALCAVLDRWGYGVTTFPVYSYLYQNFVLKRANTFGTAPIYGYFYLPLISPMAPVVFFLLAATLIAWLRRARSVLTWVTAPYVVLLLFSAHKEVRFLFPLVPFLPFLVLFALAPEPMLGARVASGLGRFASGWRLRAGYLWNACGLLGGLLLPLRHEFPMYRVIESVAAKGTVELALVRTHDIKPYRALGLHLAFLEPKNVHWNFDPTLASLEEKRSRGEGFLAMVDNPLRLPEATAWMRSRCTLTWSSFPSWVLRYNFFHWQEKTACWELYRCGMAP